MEIIAYQKTPNGYYRLVIQHGKNDFKIIIVENIHGLKDLLENQNKVKHIKESDVDGIKIFLYQDYNWCEPV